MNIHFETIESTNTFAKKYQHLFPKVGMTLISADTQTKGRGRFQRIWNSDPLDNLTLSYCFYVDKNHPLGNLPQILILSLSQIINTSGLLEIKWPNDLLLNKKKIAGVLCEVISGEDTHFVINGIGLNVANKKSFFNDLPNASSLFLETGILFDKELMKKELTETFKRNLSVFLEEGFPPFHSLLQNLSAFSKGQMLYCTEKNIKGTYQGITPQGALILKMDDGIERVFSSHEFSLHK